MSKLANPWKCDASGCGMLRANDTNHWMVIYVHGVLRRDGEGFIPIPGPAVVCIEQWNDAQAEQEGTKHACGVECGLKVAAQLIVENFFPNDIPSTGKEAADGKS